jgi:LmbE family N-acetylglucosaminyl deacetylase
MRTLEAVRRIPRAARPARVLGCEGWRDLDWLPREFRVELPVMPLGTLANDLVAVFQSQIAGGKRYDLAVEGRRRANATFGDSHSVEAVRRRREVERGRRLCLLVRLHGANLAGGPGQAAEERGRGRVRLLDLAPRSFDDLAAVLAGCRPQVLYTHNPADRHDTHVAVFMRTLEAVRLLPRDARPARVLGCEGWRDLDWLPREFRVELPVEPLGTLANDLVAVFQSQIAGGKRYDLAVEGRRRANATFGDSHSVDSAEGVILAMDLTALFHDDAADPVAFIETRIDALRTDIAARLERVAGK